MGACNWRKQWRLVIAFNSSLACVRALFGALGAPLVWAWCGCGCGCALGRGVDACVRVHV